MIINTFLARALNQVSSPRYSRSRRMICSAALMIRSKLYFLFTAASTSASILCNVSFGKYLPLRTTALIRCVIADVLKRIGIEQNEVGNFAAFNRAL